MTYNHKLPYFCWCTVNIIFKYESPVMYESCALKSGSMLC